MVGRTNLIYYSSIIVLDMGRTPKIMDKIVYCICPKCKAVRKMIDGRFNIVQKGYERNGFARFLCLECKTWFNEKTGKAMHWYSRF
jgi:transposase-like protein